MEGYYVYVLPVLLFCVGLYSFFSYKSSDEQQQKYEGPLYLSAYIKQGDIEEGRLAAKVGSPFDVFTEPNYAGYITVNETTKSNLFFWFFVAENDPSEAPLLLWLNGGPGCSSMAMLFTGGGPFQTDSAAQTLISNPHSWHQNHNILFLDQPVHTGFSFSTGSYYVENSDDAASHMYEALLQFFQLFPEYKETPFFITGESYAGKYIPAIAIHIHKMNKETSNTKINLKGIAIGNGMVDTAIQSDIPEPAFEAGFIDIPTFMELQKLKETAVTHLTSPAGTKDSSSIFDLIHGCYVEDFLRNIRFYYEHYCKKDESFDGDCEYLKFGLDALNKSNLGPRGYFERECIFDTIQYKTNTIQLYNFLKVNRIRGMQFALFLDDPQNKYILHALDKVYPKSAKLLPCETSVKKHMIKDKIVSYRHYLEELLDNYKVLLYSGQFDLIVGYPSSVNLIYHLNWSGSDDYKLAKRKLWKVDMKTAGYRKTVHNFTEILVRNAGHMVVQDQPYWAHNLITGFTRDTLY